MCSPLCYYLHSLDAPSWGRIARAIERRGRPVPKIFISYRRKDSNTMTGRMHDWLAAPDRFGSDNVLIDIDSIRAGRDFRTEIARLLTDCDVVLSVIGPGWLGQDAATQTRRIDDESDPVRLEIAYCVNNGKPIIPLWFGGMTLDQLTNLPPDIANFVVNNGFEVQEGQYFRSFMEMLERRIRADFQSEEEKEQQAVKERLAKLERDQKAESDRRRLADYEAEQERQKQLAELQHQRQMQETVVALKRAEDERARQLQEMAAAQKRAEDERARQAAAEEKAKFQSDIKAKKDTISKQESRVETPIFTVVLSVTILVAAYAAYLLWHVSFINFGGIVLAVILIGIFAVVGGIVGAMVGYITSLAFRGRVAAFVAACIGIAVGAILGALKGASINTPNGLIFGLWLGVLAAGIVMAIVSSAINAGHGEQSPWYIPEADRIMISKDDSARYFTLKTESDKAEAAAKAATVNAVPVGAPTYWQ